MKIYEVLSNLNKKNKKITEQSTNDLGLNEIITIKQQLNSLKQHVSDFQKVQNETIEDINIESKKIKDDIRCIKYEVRLVKLRNQES